MSEAVGPHLLYVEDEALILELAVTAFEEAGFSLTALQSGALAMAALDDPSQDFKALVTDVDLAAGPDGWHVARHARELFPALPVVYVSGGSAGDWSAQGVPGSVMLVKPYALAQLIVAVSTAMLGSDGAPT